MSTLNTITSHSTSPTRRMRSYAGSAFRDFQAKTGFTLVELIVVITILVILGTIAFVSLSWFSGSARDSSRVSDLSLIGKSLDIHYTKLWSFPAPTSSTGITFGSSSSVVWYQGTIGEWVIRSLGWAWARISTKPVDPLSKEEYRYSLPTGVNEYLLSADYEGDSVAWRENWELRAQNWENGTPASFWIPYLTSPNWGEELSFSPPSVGGVGGGIIGLDSASASTGSPTISYLKGTYNGVATRVSSGSTINIIALPSIFLSSGSTGTIVDASSRNFLLQGKTLSGVSFAPKVVYSSGALPSNDTERLLFSSGIVAAYSGTSLATNSDIKSFIDNVNSTGSLSAIGGNFVRNKFGGNGPTVVATASSSATSYNISNSLMFNGSNQYLSRAFATVGNQKIFTYSLWFKRGALGTRQILIGGPDTGFSLEIQADGTFYVWGGGPVGNLASTTTFNDSSIWYHVVLTYDITQSTSTNRVKLYINNQSISLSGAWPNGSDPNVNTATTHYFGKRSDNQFYFNGYLSDVYFIDGAMLDPTTFAQSGATAGQWVPKAYTGTGNLFSPTTPDITSTSYAISGGDYSGQSSAGAFDRNDSTIWGASQLGWSMSGSAYIGQNFGTNKVIRSIYVKTVGWGGWTPQSTYDIQRWNGTTWSTVTTKTLSPDSLTVIDVPDNPGGTQWRLLCTGTNTASSANNPFAAIQMYESIANYNAYGTNGFHLDFGDSVALGRDVSGATNMWQLDGVAAASSYYSLQPASIAFDGATTGSYWETDPAGATTGWLSYTWPDARVVTGYAIVAPWSTDYIRAPYSWTLEAYNWSSWVPLDTQSNQSFTTWLQTRTYAIPAPAAYTAYRLNVTAVNGGNRVGVTELQLFGNGNNFMPVNFSPNNQVIDTPTNNFATWNAGAKNSYTNITNGGLVMIGNTSGQYAGSFATKPLSETGCYWELTMPARMNGSMSIASPTWNPGAYNNYPWATWTTPSGWAIVAGATTGSTGFQWRATSGSWSSILGSNLATGEVLQFAYKNGMLWVGIKDVWQGDPSGWTGPVISGIPAGYFPYANDYYDGVGPGGATVNFWQWGQWGLTYDAASGGRFKYTPPTGFKALSSKNTGN